MIEASFEGRRSALIAGAYQYDTGQRLRLHGLPAPQELTATDELLSGTLPSVQAQYAYIGDSQTETRLAIYDEETQTWTAAVPDVFLQRNEDVHVYVYVSYGQTQEASRAKTCYEAIFRPMSRPAPGDTVTPEQVNAWDALVQEINLTIASANTAASDANAAASLAQEGAQKADAASEAARQATAAMTAETGKWAEATASATTLEPGSAATVTLTDDGAKKGFAFGIPRGADGVKGDKGDKGDTGPAGVTFELKDQILYITTDA